MIDDTLIEAVARAICKSGGYTDYDGHRSLYDQLAKAALVVAVPAVLEIAAKIADDFDANLIRDDHDAANIAHQIRAIVPQGIEAGTAETLGSVHESPVAASDAPSTGDLKAKGE